MKILLSTFKQLWQNHRHYAAMLWKSYSLSALVAAVLWTTFLQVLTDTLTPIYIYMREGASWAQVAPRVGIHWGPTLLFFLAFCAIVASLYWAHRQTLQALSTSIASPKTLPKEKGHTSPHEETHPDSSPTDGVPFVHSRLQRSALFTACFLLWALLLFVALLPLFNACVVSFYQGQALLLNDAAPLPFWAQLLNFAFAAWATLLLLSMGLYQRLLLQRLTANDHTTA